MSAMNNNQAADIKWFKDMFALFSKAFYRPEKDMANAQIASCLQDINNRFSLGVDAQIKELDEWLAENDKLHELRLEYSRLFVGPFSLPCPPYESYYRENRVMGDCTMDVKRYYHDVGLEISPEFKDAPDHVVLEADFLATLYDAENDALEQGKTSAAENIRTVRDRFIKEHANCWLPLFAQAVKNNAILPYYPVLAAILASVVAELGRQSGAGT